MVVWECCKDNQQSQWEMLTFVTINDFTAASAAEKLHDIITA